MTNARGWSCRVVMIAAIAVISMGLGGSCGSPPRPPAREPAAQLPQGDESYAALVARAEAGKTVDFYQLRRAYLESPEFSDNVQVPTGLWDRWRLALEQGRSDDLFRLSNEVLKITYLDWNAHWTRSSSCVVLQRDDCRRYMMIAMGLEMSTRTWGHDGSSCEKAWEVMSEDEISSILTVRNLTKVGERIEVDEGCVGYEVTDEQGEDLEAYFDVTRLRAAMREREESLAYLLLAIEVRPDEDLRWKEEPPAQGDAWESEKNAALYRMAHALRSWQEAGPYFYGSCEDFKMRELATGRLAAVAQALAAAPPLRSRVMAPLLMLARAMRHQWNDPAVIVKGAAIAVASVAAVPGSERTAMQQDLARLAPDDADVVNLAHAIMDCATRHDDTIARDRADELESYYDEYGLPMAKGWLEAEEKAYQYLVADLRYRLREVTSPAEVIALFRAQQRAAAVQTQSRLVTSFSFSLARFVTSLEEMDAHVRAYRKLLAGP